MGTPPKTVTWYERSANYAATEMRILRALATAVRLGAADERELRFLHGLKAEFPGSVLSDEGDDGRY